MKNLLISSLALMGLASFSRAMNNDDVVKMAQADFNEDTIITAVRSAESASFDTSTDALIELKNNKISQNIIQAVIQRQSGSLVEKSGPVSAKKIIYKNIPDAEILPADIDPVVGKEYFTRYCFKFEDGKWPTTNYWRGELVPINSKVILVALKGEHFTLKISESSKTVVVENITKYTNRDARQITRELLSDRPTLIEKYGDEMAATIKGGIPRLGMTKTQLLLTRGYPPRHETPTLESPSWRFWSSRFSNSEFVFENNVLQDGPDLK